MDVDTACGTSFNKEKRHKSKHANYFALFLMKMLRPHTILTDIEFDGLKSVISVTDHAPGHGKIGDR